MHKLNKPSLMDDDDDDMSEFGMSSNRFLKTTKQEPKPKDNFQIELESKVRQRNKSEVQLYGSDEELNQIGKNPNRFMKRDNESAKRITPVRTPTPRSIATDSEVADDSGAESLRISGNKTTGIGDSGWQPGLKKSPRASLFDERRNDNKPSNYNLNSTARDSFHVGEAREEKIPVKSPRDSKKGESIPDFSNKSNKPYQNIDDKKKNRIYEDDDDEDRSFGKSNTNFMKTVKPIDNKNQSFATDKTDSVMRPKPRASKLLSDQNEDDSYPEQFPSKSKPYDSKEYGKPDFSTQVKPRKSNLNFHLDENDEDSFKEQPSSSSRFFKGSNALDSTGKEKQDFSGKPTQKNTKFNYNLDEDDDDSFQSKPNSGPFLKGSNITDPKSKEKQDFNLKPSQKNSHFHYNQNENHDDSSEFLKTSKFQDPKLIEKQDATVKPRPRKSPVNLYPEENEEDYTHNKPSPSVRLQKTANVPEDKNKKSNYPKFNIDSRDNENDSDQDRSSKSDFLKPKQRPTLNKSSKNEDDDDYFPKPQKRESKSALHPDDRDQTFKTPNFRRDDINNPLKSDLKIKSKNDPDDNIPRHNSRAKDNEREHDFKTRSIRFEDEVKSESGRSTRESSPRKSNLTKSESRQSRSPSPVTSVCEEYERDPVKEKLEKVEQRRQERKRQKETANMSTEHRIAVEAIHLVDDSQSQRDLPPSSKRKVTIPLNKKYQNIQSKITTKPNIRSISMDHLNLILTKADEPNSDRNYSASQAIRDATYMEWYNAKLKEMKEKKKEAPVEEKETKEKKNEDDVKATYDAWLAKKKEYFKDLKRKKQEENTKQAENKENKDAKDSTFDIWKKLKDEEKKKEREKQKGEMKRTENQKMKESGEKKEKLREKKVEWEKRQIKDSKMKKEKEEEEKRIEEEKKNKADEKQMQAEISYRTWEDKMEENQQKNASFSKRRASLVQTRRAWRPSSNTVETGK